MIPMPIFTEYQVIICHTISIHRQERILMIPINEEEELLLDKGKTLNIDRGKLRLSIAPKDVQFYGEIDFTEGSDDLEEIDTAKWFVNPSIPNVCIPSDYDYKTHTCNSPLKAYRWYDTCSPAKIVKYKHACLGKPERVLIFKYIDENGKYRNFSETRTDNTGVLDVEDS